MKNKGDISLNLIIIAAIGLLVLVIVALIFTGKLGQFGKQTSTCNANSGICKTQCDPQERQLDFTCSNTDEVCCIGIPTDDGR